MLDISRASRGTGPIPDRRVLSVVQSLTMKEVLTRGEWNPNLRDEFLSTYTDWVRASRSTPVVGLDQFPERYFVNGVTQSYDIFFYEHKARRFRTLQGEYPYVRLSVDRWAHLEDDELRKDDALALSFPFYSDGGVPRNYRQLLDRCQELGVPVLIDAAYFGTCYGVTFDYSHPAIEMVSFSLSKPFCAQSFRIGILFAKRKLGYLEEIQVEARYYNRVGAYVGLKLMREFPPDYMPDKYRAAQQRVCSDLGVLPSHCLMLANLRDDDRRFDQVLEDRRFEPPALPEGARRRVCISAYLADRGSPLRQAAKRLLGR
jgi:hypothetical protein